MSSNKDDEPKMILVNKLDPMSEFIPFGKYLLSLKQFPFEPFYATNKSKKSSIEF